MQHVGGAQRGRLVVAKRHQQHAARAHHRGGKQHAPGHLHATARRHATAGGSTAAPRRAARRAHHRHTTGRGWLPQAARQPHPGQRLAAPAVRLAFSLFTQRPKAMLLMNCTTPRALSSDCAVNAKLTRLQPQRDSSPERRGWAGASGCRPAASHDGLGWWEPALLGRATPSGTAGMCSAPAAHHGSSTAAATSLPSRLRT